MIVIRRPRPNAAAMAFAAAIACSGLVACQTTIPDGVQQRVVKQPQLELVDYRHDVAFAPGSASLTPATEESVRRFLAQVGVAQGDQVYVVPPEADVATAGGDRLLAEQRRAAVAALLARNRVHSEPRSAELPDLTPVQTGVAIVVRRTVIGLLACPDWTSHPAWNFGNLPMSNWSCATAVNFGLMLADPNDLNRGRDPGSADGEYLARSIESYRKGKTRDLIRDTTSGELFPAIGPSSSSGSNGK